MKKIAALILSLAVVLVMAAQASGGTNDQGRRLAGPFCVGKRFLKPIDGTRATTRPVFGLAILRAGVVRSVARTQPCRPWEDRKLGLAWPAGAKGDKGETGATGATGAAGPTGATGAAGPAGTSVKITSTSITGANAKCLTGGVTVVFSDGTSIEVCNGLQGAKGDTGAVGPAGPKGDKGETGATGPAGPKGEQGERGLMGPAGPIGPQGLKGETGATGAVGPAGPAGPPGAKGEKGDTGATGPAGPKGDTGATGAQGPAGPVGPAGPAGPAGPKGEMGLTGPAGPIGPAGPAGPAGPKGDKGDTGDIGSIETVSANFIAGEKTITVNCPAGKHAVSGGYNIQGSVTASYRSNSSGNPTGTTSWTVTQTSGNAGSGIAYVYCA